MLVFRFPRLIAAGICLALLACQPAKKQRTSDAGEVQKLNDLIAKLKGGGSRLSGGEAQDMSAASFAKLLANLQEQLQNLRQLDTAKLAGADLVDWKFAQSILAGKVLEQERALWKKDPRVYMTFTRLSGVIGRPGDPAGKVSEITKRLTTARWQLENGILQLDTYVPRFQELGLFMAENGLVFFDRELPRFTAQLPAPNDTLATAAQEARAALVNFISFIRNELPKKTPGTFAIGEEAYNRMLREQVLLGYDADSLYRFGLSEFDKTVAEMEHLAKKIDPTKTWQQLATEIKNEYPEPHKMIEVHQEWVNKTREHVIKYNLIPIPWRERVKVVERAEYLRKTSYYGHFSFAKAKDADSIYTSEMHINPFEDQWDEKKKKEYLVEHDWGVIMVTAPHETYAGHHIQGLYQINNPRPLRRENSISIFHEGWGLYNEQLFRETGFFPNDKIILRQLQLRLWRNARVIYDVGLHTGRMSYEDAIALMRDKVGFLEWAAQLEVDGATASPGYYIGYFTGMMEILRMREDYKKWKGDQFTLSGFHEDLLKIGSMPIILMRESLFIR
ncbi:MAG TPA: hypothetical protein DCE81_10955 [Cytophagales bacterium]|nr:hypothetical protein [Cytophagales bacterium]